MLYIENDTTINGPIMSIMILSKDLTIGSNSRPNPFPTPDFYPKYPQMKLYLQRKETFSAAHRLNSLHLNKQENIDLYGKCNHQNGHGHNYTIKVVLCGKLNHETGMLLNIDQLKLSLNRVVQLLDHKNIDLDIEWFKTRPSTAENISVFVWQELEQDFKELLHKVKITETDKNAAYYMGQHE